MREGESGEARPTKREENSGTSGRLGGVHVEVRVEFVTVFNFAASPKRVLIRVFVRQHFLEMAVIFVYLCV